MLHGLSTIARITVATVVRAFLVLSIAALVFVGLGPRFGGYRVLTVLTGSMRPYARPGDLVVDRKVSLSQLRVGDVVTYQTPVDNHPVITHRIVEIRNPGPHPTIRTKGDANDGPDPWAATLNAGPGWRVSYVVPGAGRVIRFMRSSHVHTATTRLMPLLLAVLWLVVIWSPPREAEPTTVTVG